MKSLKLFCMTALAAVTLLTSCIGDTKNELSDNGCAVVTYKGTKSVATMAGGFSVYSPSLEKEFYSPGQCLYISFHIDRDDEVNANAETTGFYTADQFNYIEVNSSYVRSGTEDLEVVKDKELEVQALGFERYGIVNNYFFLLSQYKTFKADQKNSYTLSYDPDEEVEEENGKRYYNLYFRATLATEGTKTSSANIDLHAFNLSSFISYASAQEKAASKDHINMKFNFVKEFNADSTAVKTWESFKYEGHALEGDKN